MTHGHGHGTFTAVDSDDRVARRVRLVVAAVLLPLLTAATIVMISLWPGDGLVLDSIQQVRASGTVVELVQCPMAPTDCDIATVAVDEGPGAGTSVPALVSKASGVRVSVGDPVMMVHRPERAVVYERYDVVDRDRTLPLLMLGGLFAAAVVALSRWRGLAALGALAVCLAGLTEFVLPAIMQGAPPLLVAVSGGTMIMVVALFLTHGINARTAVSVVGTVTSLALTGVIGWASLGLAGVTGLGSDNVGFLSGYLHGVDLQGLLLAGLVIGALGVLDDVTVTQAAVVWELSAADPTASRRKLFAAGLRVGRAHVASTVNTLVLAYAGAALPLLMLFAARGVPADHVLSSAPVAEEVIRALAGSLGIIAAVPLTTALAAMAVGSRSGEDRDRGDGETVVDEPAAGESADLLTGDDRAGNH
ncbi:MAG TPA: YibE/F family protein [Actinokineospora sp.]|nr:YibE/F family protein [Actinokineospora sp.]